ncbi:hypothetical protein G9A89_005545 [Geosiphon pyriformis]|nr:hypothetical protein G9A89_005545 [Geosiphon pyriformis]
MPECTHDTNARFDLKYPGKEAIQLEPNSHTCIDLKIALEILATTMVQLASRNSLVKKGINIRGEIIDMGYVRNIITMLQNNSEKTYTIEPNKKIAQAIFLSLVKIAQLVSIGNREELGITAKGIQGFGSMSRIDIPVNMMKEEVIDKGEIISTRQSISIPLYDQYMLAIKRKVKNQAQLFEAEATICESGEIGLTNLYISAKSPKNIKISIYNTTESVIEIPKETIIGYLTTQVEDQPPNHVPDFLQLCRYVDITSQTIYRQNKCYLLHPEQLEQMNMRNLDPLQQMQLKMLLNKFNNIFASKNKFGRTSIIQYQIKTGDVMPIKQRTYRVPPASHKIICQEINQMLDNGLIQPLMKNVNLQPTDIYNIQEKRPKTSSNIWCSLIEITQQTTNFKVATTPDTTTLEYYQSIYTHCKQRFNIPDRIEIVEKTLYQYIENHINNYLLGNYNISEVRSNLYNNLVHYSRLGTEDLNSETLATYFQELNYNIIKYCKEKYPVQSKYSFDFESETETGNKGKQKVKQHSKTTPNTPILPKTTAKHLQTPEQRTSVKLPLSITLFLISIARSQTPNSLLNYFFRPKDFQSPRNPTQQQEPISTSTNIIEYLQENESDYSENLEKEATENKEEMATAYIAKIPEFMGENNDTSLQKWLNKVQKAEDANEELFKNWQAFKDAFLQQFTDNNISITLRNHFHNVKQETSETFIAELKDKLIKKVHSHASANLATAIRHAKSYEITIEEANHTKLTNSQKRLKATSQTNNNSNNNHKDINSHNNTTKTILDHHPTTNLKLVIIMEFQDTGNEIVGNYKETSKTGVINVTLHYNNLITNLHHQPIIHKNYKIKTVTIHQLHNQCSNNISNLYQFSHIRHHPLNNIKYQQENWFNITNPHPKINCRVTTTESIQITSWFPEILVSKDPITIILNPVILQYQRNRIFNNLSNPSNHTIPPAQIAQNTNLSDIFPFEFEANESPFLLNNAAVNKQKAITVMYTEATMEGKPIRLILDSGSAGSIITYQLIQQLKQNVNRLAQTVIVTADSIKKTPVEKIDNFSFTINGITIPVKVLANANLNWETQELKISYQGQYTIVPATCGIFNKQSEKAPVFEFEEEKEMPLTETYMALGLPSNWAEETEQEIFEEARGWKKVRYSTPEPQKEPPYILLKYKDCKKKLSSIGACVSPEEEYETCTCYFCKACHRERFGSPKRSKKWDKTLCLTCRERLPEEYNWIDVAIRGGVCDQTCQYALSILEKVRRKTLFDAAYNSALNKLYYYPHNAEMIFDLAMALINGATQEDVY